MALAMTKFDRHIDSYLDVIVRLFNHQPSGAQAVANPVFVGGRGAILAVLHTWTRALLFHPHVHMLLPAGGLVGDGDEALWRMPRKKAFPLPSFALAKHFRERMRVALVDARLATGSETVWTSRWVANVKKVGTGETTLLYLSRYIFRTAIADHRIDSFDGERVTFHWTDSATRATRSQTLAAGVFIGRFLQHVLPRGFTRVRSYGLWASACRDKLGTAQGILELHNAATCRRRPLLPAQPWESGQPRCPRCGTVYARPVRTLPRQREPP